MNIKTKSDIKSFIESQESLSESKLVYKREQIMHKLLEAFILVHYAFNKHKNSRVNNLNNVYILFKLFQLLEMDEECHQPFKSVRIILRNDVYWKKITQELGWKYIKST